MKHRRMIASPRPLEMPSVTARARFANSSVPSSPTSASSARSWSAVAGVTNPVRTYARLSDALTEVLDARVYGGMHPAYVTAWLIS
jgi:hypothetical protein